MLHGFGQPRWQFHVQEVEQLQLPEPRPERCRQQMEDHEHVVELQTSSWSMSAAVTVCKQLSRRWTVHIVIHLHEQHQRIYS